MERKVISSARYLVRPTWITDGGELLNTCEVHIREVKYWLLGIVSLLEILF